MPQPDGSQKAIGLHIFMERSAASCRRGFSPWDREPGSTMTNADVDIHVAGVDGQTMTVKYKDGEKKIIVPPEHADRYFRAGHRWPISSRARSSSSSPRKKAAGRHR